MKVTKRVLFPPEVTEIAAALTALNENPALGGMLGTLTLSDSNGEPMAEFSWDGEDKVWVVSIIDHEDEDRSLPDGWPRN